MQPAIYNKLSEFLIFFYISYNYCKFMKKVVSVYRIQIKELLYYFKMEGNYG